MSENGPSFEKAPPSNESTEHRTMPRLRNACAAGLVLLAAGCNGDQQENDTTKYLQRFREAPTLSDKPMESILEKTEKGIAGELGHVLGVLAPDLKQLSLYGEREFSYNLSQRPDGLWYLSGFTPGSSVAVESDIKDIEALANRNPEQDTAYLHNHNIAAQLTMQELIGRPGKKSTLEEIGRTLKLISSGNWSELRPVLKSIERQLELIRNGEIPSPPDPPSIVDLWHVERVKASYQASWPDTKPPKNYVTAPAGIWEYSCKTDDSIQYDESTEHEGIRYRNMKKYPKTPEEQVYSTLQSEMSRPYSEPAVNAYLHKKDRTIIDKEYKVKVDSTARLVEAARVIGCDVSYTPYKDLGKSTDVK